jgi:hypothetical protein
MIFVFTFGPLEIPSYGNDNEQDPNLSTRLEKAFG